MTSIQYRVAALVFAITGSYAVSAQNYASTADLPDAPIPAGQSTSPVPQGTAQINGIVLDVQGVPVAAATVALSASGKLGERNTNAASDGSFTFTGLVAAEYRLIVTSPGLDTYTSAPFALKAGESLAAPSIALKVSTSTSVNVFAGPEQIAIEQVHAEEQQRVLGVFPNFYTSYIWDAEPMPVKLKYKLAVRSLIDPFHFLIIAGVAGAEHYNGTYPDYGPGIEGFGKRYGAAMADATVSRIVGSAILPAVLHQDPRYFYQGSGGVGSRTWHAVSSVFVTRGDNGKHQPNFSHMIGSLTAGAVANVYHPASSRGARLTFQTFGITVGGNIVGNLIREFVLRGLVPTVPDFANGKQEPQPDAHK